MKQYVKPRTIEVVVNAESVMVSYSATVGFDNTPEMGTDGEGEYGRCLNDDYTDFT